MFTYRFPPNYQSNLSWALFFFSLHCNLFFEKIYLNEELVKFWSVFGPFKIIDRLHVNMNFFVGSGEYYHLFLAFPSKLGHPIKLDSIEDI